MNEQFINWAKKKLGDNIIVVKEAHGDQSDVFRLSSKQGNFHLKVSKNLKEERKRLEWLNGKLPVPEVVDFISIGNKDALLLSSISGLDLSTLAKKWPAEKIVSKLAEVLRKFHATNIDDCPFGESGLNKILIHGDACLPNFIFEGNDFSGYIDLGDMMIGDLETDLAAAVWSLQYNTGAGHGLEFLKKYGIKDADEEMVGKLILRYEDMQRNWGL